MEDSVTSDVQKSKHRGGKLFIALLGGLLGIFLLVSGGRSNEEKTDNVQEEIDLFKQKLTVEEYRNAIQMRVCAIASQVAGVGNSVAVVSLEGGFEYVYATETKTSGVGESVQYIVIGSGDNESLVYLTERVPRICGIGLVCDGGDDPDVRREVTYLLSAAFEVPSNKIYVTRKK